MEELTKEKICNFVQKSLQEKEYNHELLFSLSPKTVEKVKKNLHLNLNAYIAVISSHSIRHINKNHKNDLLYICEIMEIVESFSKVKKSIRRDQKTGANLVSLEFYKHYKDKIYKRLADQKLLKFTGVCQCFTLKVISDLTFKTNSDGFIRRETLYLNYNTKA